MGEDAAAPVMGGAEEDAPQEVYYRTRGLRCVRPYWYDFETHVKGRWVGRTLLDVFLKEFPHHSEAYYKTAIELGRILIDGWETSAEHKVQHNEKLTHSLHRHEYPVLDLPVKILAESDRFYAVDKPASIPVHPCGRYAQNTLVSILRNEQGMAGVLHPVHRLDKVTSGVLLFAKSPKDAEAVGQLLRKEESKNAPEADRKVIKEYVARVVGAFPKGKIVCEYAVCCTDAKRGTMRSIIPSEASQAVPEGDAELLAMSSERQALLKNVEAYRHRRAIAHEADPGPDAAAEGERKRKREETAGEEAPEAAATKRQRVEGAEGAEGGFKHMTKREKHKPKGYDIAAEKKKKKELYRKLSNSQAGDAKMIPKPATTEFYCLKTFATSDGQTHSLVRCLPLTGRTHQIRVHLQALGHPIVDDVLYNPDPVSVGSARPPPQADEAPLPTFSTDELCKECQEGGEAALVAEASASLDDARANNMTICLHARRYKFYEGDSVYEYEAPYPAWAEGVQVEA